MKRVVYISWMPLTNYVKRTWFIDDLIKSGVLVEYWDITKIYRENIKEFGELKEEYIIYIQNFNEIKKYISDLINEDVVYILLLSPSIHTLALYRLFKKFECKTVFIKWGGMPIKAVEIHNFRRILQKLLDPLRIFGILYFEILQYLHIKLHLVSKYSLCFVAGESLLKEDNFACKVSQINMSDYDTYVKSIANKTEIITGRYAVFLDIYLPFQSDLVLTKTLPLDPDEYYRSICNFFKHIEGKYGIKVVIASHHKANNTLATFDGRNCYYGKTAELVKHADFVISHHSTSIGFAALNKKPVIFIYTEGMYKLYRDSRVQWIKDLAKYFQVEAYNVDDVGDIERVKKVKSPDSVYEDYKYQYMTTHKSEFSSATEIFLKEIHQF